jgi:hypothetical protein
MKYQSVIGIGYYGRPETLTRVLKKIVEKYILGNSIGPGRKDGRYCVQFETIKMLKALFGGLLENHQLSEPEIIENIKKSGITGFFLALERRRLNLSVFTLDRRPVNSMNLDGQTETKRTQLH